MIIVIEGINRTEFCTPNVKDEDRRRFYETRGQLYRVYPEQLTRMRIYEFGKEVRTESVIFFQENCIHPHIEKGEVMSCDKMLADIDEHKIMTAGTTQKRAWGVLSSGKKTDWWNIGMFAIVGVVLLYALLSNGGF